MQRPDRPDPSRPAIRFSCVASRFRGECFHNRVEARIDSFDAAQMRFNDLSGGKVFCAIPRASSWADRVQSSVMPSSLSNRELDAYNSTSAKPPRVG